MSRGKMTVTHKISFTLFCTGQRGRRLPLSYSVAVPLSVGLFVTALNIRINEIEAKKQEGG